MFLEYLKSFTKCSYGYNFTCWVSIEIFEVFNMFCDGVTSTDLFISFPPTGKNSY